MLLKKKKQVIAYEAKHCFRFKKRDDRKQEQD